MQPSDVPADEPSAGEPVGERDSTEAVDDLVTRARAEAERLVDAARRLRHGSDEFDVVIERARLALGSLATSPPDDPDRRAQLIVSVDELAAAAMAASAGLCGRLPPAGAEVTGERVEGEAAAGDAAARSDEPAGEYPAGEQPPAEQLPAEQPAPEQPTPEQPAEDDRVVTRTPRRGFVGGWRRSPGSPDEPGHQGR